MSFQSPRGNFGESSAHGCGDADADDADARSPRSPHGTDGARGARGSDVQFRRVWREPRRLRCFRRCKSTRVDLSQLESRSQGVKSVFLSFFCRRSCNLMKLQMFDAHFHVSIFIFFFEHSEGDIVIPWTLGLFTLFYVDVCLEQCLVEFWLSNTSRSHPVTLQPHRFQLVADVDDADGYAGLDGHGRVPWVELGNCRQSHPMRSIGCALIPTDTIIHIHTLFLFFKIYFCVCFHMIMWLTLCCEDS